MGLRQYLKAVCAVVLDTGGLFQASLGSSGNAHSLAPFLTGLALGFLTRSPSLALC